MFLGTCVEGVIVSRRENDLKSNIEDYLPYLGWGMALTCSYLVAGGISGGHFNASVSLGLTAVNRCGTGRALSFIAAQFFGAIMGSTIALLCITEMVEKRYPSDRSTNIEASGIVAPQLQAGFSWYQAVFSSFLASFIFLVHMSAITDIKNMHGK